MNFLADYPDVLTVDEVATILRLKPNTIYSLKGLRKTRIGNGRGMLRFRKVDVISYINAGVEEEGKGNADHETKRYRDVGISGLISWKEVQTIRVESEGRCTESR